MNKTEPERITVLETLVPIMAADIKETKANVAILLEAHYKQRGAIKLLSLMWAGLIGLGGLLIGRHWFGH